MQTLFRKRVFLLCDLANWSDSPQMWTCCVVIAFVRSLKNLVGGVLNL